MVLAPYQLSVQSSWTHCKVSLTLPSQLLCLLAHLRDPFYVLVLNPANLKVFHIMLPRCIAASHLNINYITYLLISITFLPWFTGLYCAVGTFLFCVCGILFCVCGILFYDCEIMRHS